MSPRAPRDPVEEDLRIQLEGTWEVLEQARERQGALLETLQSPLWRRRLRQRPELAGQIREQEAPLAEALTRAEHRLQKESSPEHHPLHRLLRQLHQQRTYLERRLQERLDWPGDLRAASLVKVLERLEAELIEPRPWPPGPEEPVLLSGGPNGLMKYPPILCIGIATIFQLLTGFPWISILFFPSLPLLLMTWANLRNVRHYWLTPRRVVWKPIVGRTQQMPLDSLATKNILRLRALRAWDSLLQLDGRRRVVLANLEHLDLLEALLRIHCEPPLRGQALTPPTYPLALFPAIRRPSPEGPDYWAEPGLIVVRPGRVAFLLEQNLDGILRTLFASWTSPRPVGLSLHLLMRQLSLLPAEDFDRCVEAAARLHKGEFWSAASILHGPAPSGRGYQFARHQGPVIIGFPEASQSDTLSGLLRPEPSGGVSPVR